jgi:hypothetical protein
VVGGGGGGGGVCGNLETEDPLFFNCPILGSIWRKIVSWLGVPLVFSFDPIIFSFDPNIFF